MKKIEILPWDSDFFGFPIGKLADETLGVDDIPQLAAEAEELGIRCLYFDCRADDYESARAAAEAKFVLVDVKVVFSLSEWPGADNDEGPLVTCRLTDGVGKLELVAVAKKARGQGVGTRIVREACRWLATQDAERADVVTQARNIATQRLYQRCGFRPSKCKGVQNVN